MSFKFKVWRLCYPVQHKLETWNQCQFNVGGHRLWRWTSLKSTLILNLVFAHCIISNTDKCDTCSLLTLKRSSTAVLMLVQRLRCWTDIKPADDPGLMTRGWHVVPSCGDSSFLLVVQVWSLTPEPLWNHPPSARRYLVNTRCWTNVVSMLAQRRRRCTNIETMLLQRHSVGGALRLLVNIVNRSRVRQVPRLYVCMIAKLNWLGIGR